MDVDTIADPTSEEPSEKPTDPPTEARCCPPLLEGPIGHADAEALASMLRALADPVRLRLVSLVASAPGGEACACHLVEPVGRSQPTVSHHLSQLVAAGLLEREQRGRWAWFRLRDEALADLCRALGAARGHVGTPPPTP